MKNILLSLAIIIPVAGCSAVEESTMKEEGSVKLSTLIVSKDAQKKQCMGDGIALEIMAKELTDAGLTVACSERSNDGKMYAQACGMDEGTINVYKVKLNEANDLKKVNELGFEVVKDLKMIKAMKSCK